MNTANILFTCLMTINYSTLYAMEIIELLPQKKDVLVITQIKKPNHIPHLSFKEIRCSFKAIDNIYQSKILPVKIEKLLSQSFTFNMALLPQEITYKIIEYMFYAYNKNELSNDKNNELIEKFYIKPLLCTQKKHIEIQKMVTDLLHNNKEIADFYNNDELIPVFFNLPDDQYQEIMELLSPPLVPSPEIPILIINQFEEDKIKNYPLTIRNILRIQKVFSIKKTNPTDFVINEQKINNKHTIGDKKNPKGTIIGAIAGLGCGAIFTIMWGSGGITRDMIFTYTLCSTLLTTWTTLSGTFIGIGIDRASNYFIERNTVNVDI